MPHAYLAMISTGCLWALTVAMLAVIYYDARYYIIPNRLNLLLVVLFAATAWALPVAWLPSLAAAGVVFAIGLAIFALGLMGGGDIKLLAALSLWAGWPGAGSLLFLTAMAGGALVLVVLPLRLLLPRLWFKCFPTRNLPRILTRKQPVPYGIAIAAAFLWMLWTHAVPGMVG